MSIKTEEKKLQSPFAYNLIYIYEIPDEDHKNCLKIGKASFSTNEKIDIHAQNTEQLNKSARDRINQQTGTSAVRYYLKHTEIAIKEEIKDGKKQMVSFLDDDVHEVLINSGIHRAKFDLDANPREWFKVELQTAINAIKAVKEGRKSLNNSEINSEFKGITLYPNQEEAVERTLTTFKNSNSMLWDAKMRFGKTITALELVKRMSKLPNAYGDIKKVIIATHRPEVIEQWSGDFKTVFYEKASTWKFGSKVKGFGLPVEDLIKNDNFICFASLQDLRGAKLVGGNFVKNQELYDTKWDLLIIDEAHEGTLTERGENVFKGLIDDSKDHKTKVLRLSGTPFNIIDQYTTNEIYSWSYIDEQEAKQNWDYFKNPKNPYAKMPKMNVYTYDLGTIINNPHYLDDKMFNFGEFFRVWTGNKEDDIADDGTPIAVGKDKVGKFVHEQDVIKFLNLLSKEDESNNYPFSTKEYQDYFKHTLWMLPGVKEAHALSLLLNNHEVFGHGNFKIVNVAGDGDEIEENNEEALRKTKRALDKVKDAIAKNERTITLSCQRLTTGVTVPEWTAVFMLYGSSQVAAQRYMQTIFRVQSPANIDGKIKENCFVFEFAPDRALKVLAKTAHLSHQAGKVNSPETKKLMEKLLEFCPVIAINGSQMNAYDVPMMIKQLKSAYIDDIVDSGFENKRIYNLEQLRLENIDLKDFEGCDHILKGASQTKNSKLVKVTENDLDKKDGGTVIIREKQEKTPEQKQKEKEAQNAMRILNAIMTKVPLMVYGLTLDEDKEITYDNFTTLIDDASWNEFMPKDATKEKFKLFKKYIDTEMFELCNEELRNQVNAANKLSINERIKRLTPLFLKFRNPDKETVLTPWRVVNMHLGDCLGGYNFYNENYSVVLDEPRFIDHGQVTNQVLKNKEAKILEINSKTGLYPLYVTYSLFRARLNSPLENRTDRNIWKETVEKNIFVVCRTKMAEAITKRTLVGNDRNIKVNVMTIDNMIEDLRKKPDDVISKILNKTEWNIQEGGKMKFDAIVGNPPYQLTSGKTESQTQGNSTWIYQYFQFLADKLGKWTSLIYPFGGWFDSPSSLGGLGNAILKDGHTISIQAYEGTTDRRAWYRTDKNPEPIFEYNANLSAGVAIVLRNFEKHSEFKYSNRIYSDKVVSVKVCNADNLPPNPLFISINEKLGNKKLISQVKKGVFSVESNFVELNPNFVSHKKEDWKNPIQLLTNDKSGSSGRARWYWTDKSMIKTGQKYFGCYKVVISSAYPKKSIVSSTPTIENVKSRLKILVEILPPNSAFGRSRMALFMSENKNECDNFIKYLETNFFAGLTLQEPNRRSTFGDIIPLQDFTNKSDIDWSKSVAEIDKQLYKKYNLTQEEIDFIEKTVKPME